MYLALASIAFCLDPEIVSITVVESTVIIPITINNSKRVKPFLDIWGIIYYILILVNNISLILIVVKGLGIS